MNTKVNIQNKAWEDLFDGFRFYERQEIGLGDYFIESLVTEIRALKNTGGIHPRFGKKYHRALSEKFPHAIYYRVAGGTVHVEAVIDCRRNPAWIHRRLGGR